MNEQPDTLEQQLRESGARYVVGTQGQPVAVLLSIDEYEHYLDLLDDEADSQVALRLAQAATRNASAERESFRVDVKRRRENTCR